MQTKGHSKFLFILLFLRIQKQTEKFNENRADKRQSITCNLSILSIISKVCEYSPSQQHFLIVSHKPNNKGIILVCPL